MDILACYERGILYVYNIDRKQIPNLYFFHLFLSHSRIHTAVTIACNLKRLGEHARIGMKHPQPTAVMILIPLYSRNRRKESTNPVITPAQCCCT
jgi:hypothetical protein